MTEPTHITPTPSAAPRCWALVPCAGTGSRAGAIGPKQYQMLLGQPLVMHTLAAFAEVLRVKQTLVVVSPDDQFLRQPEFENNSFSTASCGGSTRAASVFNGLNALLAEGADRHDWVLVHDAARCLITPAHARTAPRRARPRCRVPINGWRKRRRCFTLAVCMKRCSSRVTR